MAGVPYTFATATTSIPLSQLDANFNTQVTIGTSTVGLGNTTTSLVGLSNVSTTTVGSTGSLAIQSGSTTAITVDTSQNVGIGVTPSSISSSYKSIELGALGNEWSSISGTNNFSTNAIRGTNWTYASTNKAFLYQQDVTGDHLWFNAPSSSGTISWTQAMTLDTSGNLLVGATSTSVGRLYVGGVTGGAYSNFGGDHVFYTATGGTPNAASTCYKVYQVNATGRSINAAGTVNAAGADYAEYMVKAGDFTIAKGDICGIDANGKLTNVFGDAVSFVVKSTNPSYVGGDTWGSEEVLGLTKPISPVKAEGESDADFETAQTNYQTALTAYQTQLDIVLEAARQKVDRIAFAGQVPVNLTGATVGQYIVPISNSDGSIGGQAINESDLTLQQYAKSVGKVISIINNVTTIIVKVA